MEIRDLDLLRPKPKMIHIGGKDIDISFIPCGITFDVDMIIRELQNIDQNKLLENGPETKKAFELSIDLCVAFCSYKYPELDKQWFMDNTDAKQIREFSSAIKDALISAYDVGEYSKNSKAPKKKIR